MQALVRYACVLFQAWADTMFRRLLMLCVFLAYASAAAAQHKAYKDIESSLLVTGTIDVTAAGDVAAYALKQSDQLPTGIVDMVASVAPHWKFEPIALQANAVSRSEMNLLFIAKKQENGKFSLNLRSAYFMAPPAAGKEEQLALDKTGFKPPVYPLSLQYDGVAGNVYVAIKVGRDGRVIDADVMQIDLRKVGSQPQLQRWRNAFKRSALAAAKTWTFHVPAAGPNAGQAYWVGTVPIAYAFDPEPPAYGSWQTYVPGPYTVIPWMSDKHIADRDPGAMSPNTFHAEGEGRCLLTPLNGG